MEPMKMPTVEQIAPWTAHQHRHARAVEILVSTSAPFSSVPSQCGVGGLELPSHVDVVERVGREPGRE